MQSGRARRTGASSAGGDTESIAPTAALDQVDRAILRALTDDARIPNNALAELVGVAPSTCLGRVRSLRERGVIRGFYADIDPASVGRAIQAMISVRMQSHARNRLAEFAASVARLPEVLNVFFLAGADDFLLHVAARDTENLRDFVVTFSGNADIALTETNLIFEHVRSGAGY
ncbi:MAG: Lrp/AsnC family transcriptional regulator [Actinobacteria bacterium]|nr:Lrp/AsnC family transcriptional regulator [Actinomycetota bacterium]